MTTFSVVGKNLSAAPTAEVKFPENLKLEIPDIKLNPTFHPQFSPTFAPQITLDPKIECYPLPVKVEVEHMPVSVNIEPVEHYVTVRSYLEIRHLRLALILFANTLFFVMLQFIVNRYF